jgi:hypothetical protein
VSEVSVEVEVEVTGDPAAVAAARGRGVEERAEKPLETAAVGEARWLAMGTADPHGVGDVDRVLPGRAPALRLGTLSGATDAELMLRPLPAVNVAPDTAPRSPPAALAGAPCVTRIDQVVPRHSQAVVRQWTRQLRRCFRAAKAGNLSLAKRLRPADVWLEHAEHSVPETAVWNWDLRPLAEGLPAHPLPVSGRDGVLPATGLALGVLEQMVAGGLRAQGFIDEAIVSEMLHGVEDDSACRRGTLLCAPHAGGLASIGQMLAKTAASTAAGWATSGHTSLPCWPLRSCPISIVDESIRAGKPKWRLTTDLSWPHSGAMMAGGLPVDAVNAAMDRSRWPVNRMMRVTELAEAGAILQSSCEQAASGGGVAVGAAAGRSSSWSAADAELADVVPGAAVAGRGAAAPCRRRRVKQFSLDCIAYYRKVGRQRAELWRNAVFLPDGVQLDERCCFGDASAATKCSRISNFVIWRVRAAYAAVDAACPIRDVEWLEWKAARRAAGVGDEHAWVGMFVDDIVGVSADDELVSASGVPRRDESGAPVRRAQAYFEAARGVLLELGWGSEPSKEREPCDRLDALGAEIDLDSGRVRLTAAKRERYAAHADDVASGEQCDRVSFMRLLGRLTSAVQCYPFGRQYLHAAWRASRASYRLRCGGIAVSRAVRRDLRWWAAELRDPAHQGVPLACAGAGEASCVYADASGEIGWMAWTVRDDELVYAIGEWTPEERTQLIICEKELLASTWGVVALRAWLNRTVVSYTDNTVAMAAMRSMAPKTEVMQAIAARRTAYLFEGHCMEESRRITSKANLWADLGSRRRLADVLRQAAAFGLRVRRAAVPAGWEDTSHLCELARARDALSPPLPRQVLAAPL